MDVAYLNLACAWALVDGLVAGGVRHACLSPGSRSTPLALALSRHPDVDLHVHLDERSSAFFATGIARASGRPVALACTSGTAAAEFLPAVVEASQSRLPLVVLTADRPPRLRGTGANQTIDQVGLYGTYARETLDLPVPEAAGQEAWWRQAAREALEAAHGDPVGPVHVNCPFEEPLSPSPDARLPAPTGETIDLPATPEAELTAEEADRLMHLVSGAQGAVVIGGWPGDITEVAKAWAGTLGWPVLAEPTSNARRPGIALAQGQGLIGDASWAERQRPDVVIQLGAAPTTRATQAFVAGAERLVVADRRHLDADPDHLASWRLAVDAEALGRALGDRPVRIVPAPTAWTDAWRDADLRARAALDDFLDGIDDPFEPRIARDVAAAVPEGGTLFVGNSGADPRSRPRDVATRGAARAREPRRERHRRARVDRARRRRGRPAARPSLCSVICRSSTTSAPSRGTRAGASTTTLVVVRNGGGHIFSAMAQRDLPEHRSLFVTPHDADLGALTRAAGAGHVLVERAGDLGPALSAALEAGGLQIVEVAVDPEASLTWRDAMRDAIAAAIA